MDIDLPASVQKAFQAYEPALKRYGRVLYAIYRPTENRQATQAAVTAMLDIMFEERGQTPLSEFKSDADAIESAWFDYLMPTVTRDQVSSLLKTRRYVVIQGPPGTGKTRMAREMLEKDYGGIGQTIQFHPNTTYENFVGGLAPVQEKPAITVRLGFASLPNLGFSWKLRPSLQRPRAELPAPHRRD